MSKTTTALLIEFVMIFVFAGIALAFMVKNPWSWILLVATIGTAINYFLGDLYLLPKFGNIVAAVSDGIVVALVAYLTSLMVPVFNVTLAALALLAVLVAVGEYFLHQYLAREQDIQPTP